MKSKINLYFTSKIRNYLDLFSTPMAVKRALAKDVILVFNSKFQKLAVVVHVSRTTQKLVLSRSCFAEDGKDMYKDL